MSLVGKRNYFSFDFIPVIVIDLIRIYFSVRSTSLEQKFFFFFFGFDLIVSACRPRIARSCFHSLYRVHGSIAVWRNSRCLDASSMSLHAQLNRIAIRLGSLEKNWDTTTRIASLLWWSQDEMLKGQWMMAYSTQLNWQWATLEIIPARYVSLVTLWPCYLCLWVNVLLTWMANVVSSFDHLFCCSMYTDELI